MTIRARLRPFGIAGAVLLGAISGTQHEAVADSAGISLRFIGEAQFKTGHVFQKTELGGLSGIDYDAARNRYYAISDDRSEKQPARFYTLTINLSDGKLAVGDVAFQNVTFLKNRDGKPFSAKTVDPESIRYDAERDSLFWTSEGNAAALVPPFIREASIYGDFVREFALPANFAPTSGDWSGIRNNLAFESLTPIGKGDLLTATENALKQDGNAASLTEGSPARIVRYSTSDGQPGAQYVYVTEPVPHPPVSPEKFKTNGLVELLAITDLRVLAIERGFSVGAGNTIRLFEGNLTRATDVAKLGTLAGKKYTPIGKKLVFDFDRLGIKLDNVEGITFGPTLSTGERTLILVSDNNFNPRGQFTQFLAFAIER